MVSVSVRQNPGLTPGRNTSASTPFGSQQLQFTVGFGARPLRPGDPLEFVAGDGFFDWAGRRLFLVDGAPDPDTPGIYRYQHSPACCDTRASDSDPVSPRYEPVALRHRHGDSWVVDADRPFDPDDPGVFGSPGWRPDKRTGRHRRGELPDPLPPSEEDLPGHEWAGIETVPVRRWKAEPQSDEVEEAEPHRFSPLREKAFSRFMSESAGLAAAHLEPDPPAIRERIAWLWVRLLWVLTFGIIAPSPLRPVPADGAGGPARAASIPAPRRPNDRAAAAGSGRPPFVGAGTMAGALAGARRYWQAQPDRSTTARPRPSPRPAPETYMAAWERAFAVRVGHSLGLRPFAGQAVAR